jgi:predicted nucleic acid-binding protein
VTLCDTGPLVALVIKNDKYREPCVQALRYLRRPLLTTWPCFVEAMYLVGGGGFGPIKLLWEYLLDGPVRIHVPQADEMVRMAELMEQYQNVPMDMADASLVAAAETLNLRRIFSTDGDFYIYRPAGDGTFEVIPGPN